MKTKVSARNIARMVALPALVIAVVVTMPVVADHLEKRQEQLDRIRADKQTLYDARLQPCPEGIYQPGLEAIVVRSGDVAVDIFPAFHPPEGFKLSGTTLSGYDGVNGVSYPPPPPPPPGIVVAPNPPSDVPRFKLRPPVVLDQETAGNVLRVLKTEIDEADAERYVGMDGTGYVLRHGDKCATAWSPEPGTRAHKIVGLVHVLNQLSTEKSEKIGGLQAEIAQLTSSLDADRRELQD